MLRWTAWRADGEGWKADVAARERSQRVDESAIVKEMEMRVTLVSRVSPLSAVSLKARIRLSTWENVRIFHKSVSVVKF